MPELHLREPGFAHNACGRSKKTEEQIEKFKETGSSKYIYLNKFDKEWFQ